jgi:hypothetical protein
VRDATTTYRHCHIKQVNGNPEPCANDLMRWNR